MSKRMITERSGYLLVGAGAMFLLAALLGRQVAFCGVGIAFVAIGASCASHSKRAQRVAHGSRAARKQAVKPIVRADTLELAAKNPD